MQLSPHFSLDEFTASQKAAENGIDNSLPPQLVAAALSSAAMMERIRWQLSEIKGVDVPISVTSGYRCPALNTLVGSAPTSDHPLAMAWDWTAPSFGPPFDVCQALLPYLDDLGIGQLIHEFGTWVHASAKPVLNSANRVITIDHQGTRSGVLAIR